MNVYRLVAVTGFCTVLSTLAFSQTTTPPASQGTPPTHPAASASMPNVPTPPKPPATAPDATKQQTQDGNSPTTVGPGSAAKQN